MANAIYPSGYLLVHQQSLNFVSDTIVAMLVTSAYTFSSTHQFVSSVVANEAAGTSRQTLATKSISDSGTAIVYDCADLVFPTPNSSQTLGWVIYYKANTSDADHQLLLAQDPTDLSSNGLDVTVTISASGLMTFPY